MIISQLSINDIVSIHFPKTKNNDEFYEYAIVIAQDDKQRQMTVKILGQDSELVLPWDKKDVCDQIVDIPLDKSWLVKLMFKEACGRLYMLPEDENWWELPLRSNGISFTIRVKREPSEWVMIVPKDSAWYGCRFESLSTVRSLQNKIRKEYGIELPNKLYEALS